MYRVSIAVILLVGLKFQSLANDTLQFPIHNGLIKYSKVDSMLYSHPNGINIFATTDFKVLSCSDGKVAGVAKLTEGSYIVTIESRTSCYYIYGSLDSVFVKKGQAITVGYEIGSIVKKSDEKSYITFSVMRNKKSLRAENFVIRKQRLTMKAN